MLAARGNFTTRLASCVLERVRDAGPDGGNRVLERVREAIGADGAAGGVLGGDGIGGVAVGCMLAELRARPARGWVG